MTKQEQFLWVVQTMVLTNSVNVASNPAIDRSAMSVTGLIVAAGEALRASELIPDDMSAIEAANEFCYSMLPNLREKGVRVPSWFALP
ncbi:MAG TPA: hypothetical protein VNU92_09545 [Edaphobacter sp.]|jgi:hypothetical protein|nr:hypothetical protein [Edaphobacter sp.]